jgi:hypothetical protein
MIRKVAYDARALEMSVHIVDRQGGIPFDPNIPSPLSSHWRLLQLVIAFYLYTHDLKRPTKEQERIRF